MLRLLKAFQRQNYLKHLNPWLTRAGIFLLFSPLLIDLSMRCLLNLLPKDQGEPVELIVILGRGPDSQAERALVASQLWSERQSPHVFVSGMTDAPPTIRILNKMGVPEEQISGERCSQTTWENALFSDILLSSQEKKRILLVTDKLHMVRAFLVFQRFGFDVIPHPIQRESEGPFSLERFKTLFRESTALVLYGVTGKFQTDYADKQRKDRVEAHQKITQWNCYLQQELR